MSHKKAGLEPAPTAQNIQSLFPHKKRITVYGFSMVEIMITMVIVSTCLVIVLRVFSLCSKTVSKSSMETRCVNIFKDKIDRMYIKSIEEDGLDITGESDEIVVNDISVSYIQETSRWGEETLPYPEEQEEDAYSEEAWDLLEIDSSISWGNSMAGKEMKIKSIFPAKGIRHEYI